MLETSLRVLRVVAAHLAAAIALGVIVPLAPPLARPVVAQAPGHSMASDEVQQLVKLDTLWLAFLRQRNARDYAISSPNGISEDRFIDIGGIEQWISIRGEDRTNPVILLVHGGPGDATSLYGWAMLRPWFSHFTVVQWDQRGAGKTYGRNGPSTPDVTIDRIVRDGIELSDSVRRMFDKDKIILLGHSFGSIVGLEMAKARPDLYTAFVGTGQIGATSDTTLAVAYRAVLAAARRRGDRSAVRELTEIGPPPWRDGRAYAVEHKWANLLEHADEFLSASLAFKLTAPSVTMRDINDDFDGELFSGDHLVPQLKDIDPALFRASYAVPIYVIQGAEDLTAPPILARALVRHVHAPKKDFVAITNGGHFALFTQPDAFLDSLIARVGSVK